MLPAFLASIALAALVPGDDCPRIEVESSFGPDDLLSPENETFTAIIRYVQDPGPPSASCAAPPLCTDMFGRVRFDVAEKPAYAAAWFEPEDAPMRFNTTSLRDEASTTFFVRTTSLAPAYEDGRYEVEVKACDKRAGKGAITIKNDYGPRTGFAPGTPFVEDDGPVAVPSVSSAVLAAGIIGAAILVRTRRT